MQETIIPAPCEVSPGDGELRLPANPSISCPAAWEAEAGLVAAALGGNPSVQLEGAAGDVVLRETALPPEAYELRIGGRGVEIDAGSASGAYYAAQTLRQWLPQAGGAIPRAIIRDAPRFRWRALMIDPARHFWNVDDIRRYIVAMASYKLNKLHLHLTDDQGWRLPCGKWPKLAAVAAWRRETEGDGERHGGIYTKEELQGLVAFAARHHVELIPELDLPGHSQALLAAYPELACFPRDDFAVRTVPGVSEDLVCPGREALHELYADLFRELAEIFPSPYVHLGGDEAPLTRWEACPACRALRQAEGLATPREEMGWFFRKMSGLLERHGKRPLFWFEENASGYPAQAAVYAWRMGKTPDVMRLAREKGLPLICSPGEHAYFDYPQSGEDAPAHPGPVTTLEQVYRLDPGHGLPTGEQSHVWGAEATLWGERVPDLDTAFHLTYPRALAFAEACWSQMPRRGWRHFALKLPEHLRALKKHGIGEMR